MSTKLSDVASIAEIIASVGVIVSLIFVGLQISEGNKETRAATIQSASDSQLFLMSELLRYADTWEKVTIGSPLVEGEESRRGIVLFNLVMAENANLQHQFNAGYLDAAAWANRQDNFRRLVALPIFEKWRGSIGANGHSPEFLQLVDSYRAPSQ